MSSARINPSSLARPGGNLTGTTVLAVELAPKRLEPLHEVLSETQTIAALINPREVSSIQAQELAQAAGTLRLQLDTLDATTEEEVRSAFESVVRLRAGGLVIAASPFFTDMSEQLALLSTRHMLPAISHVRDFVAAGGLMSYGPPLTDAYKIAGAYVARILNGEKPADLPVQQSTKVELVINMKTAKALGITVPLALQAAADEVIE
jgi:putative tryptophan/tyrosine transport system substrate-binding protein